jgi:uncharacterized membrane protein
MAINLLSFIGEIFGPAADLVDNLHTSKEEKLILKQSMLGIQVGFLEKAVDMEMATLKAKSEIITAEAKSEHWVTATWRPITMLAFVASVMAYWFGLTPDDLPQESVDSMFTLVQLGLGGYVVGRSAEKIVPGIMDSFRKKEKV